MVARSRAKDQSGMNIRTPKSRAELEEAKRLREESERGRAEAEKDPEETNRKAEDECRVVAFARILSGPIKFGQKVYCYGPKYRVSLEENTWDPSTVGKATVTELFLLRGRNLESISCASSGAIAGIAGLDAVVLKTATVSSLPPGVCLPLGLEGCSTLGADRDAIVKVAVEPHVPAD